MFAVKVNKIEKFLFFHFLKNQKKTQEIMLQRKRT